jgi:hypothetical protein
MEFVHRNADTLEKIFVTMGEPKSSTFLSQRIRDYIGLDATVPEAGTKTTLEL